MFKFFFVFTFILILRTNTMRINEKFKISSFEYLSVSVYNLTPFISFDSVKNEWIGIEYNLLKIIAIKLNITLDIEMAENSIRTKFGRRKWGLLATFLTFSLKKSIFIYIAGAQIF